MLWRLQMAYGSSDESGNSSRACLQVFFDETVIEANIDWGSEGYISTLLPSQKNQNIESSP